MERKRIEIKEGSGIPLIGNIAFGIIYRNTSIIEIKPVTGCNLNCIFCSVAEGPKSKKDVDYSVDKDYLVDELKKLIVLIEETGLEIHIGTNGEPLLYPQLTELVRDVSAIKEVKDISIDTNGTLLNEKRIDELAGAGLTRINLSINSLNPERAKTLADAPYDIEKIKGIAEYIPKKCELLIAPILVPKHNEEDIEEIIQFALKLKARLGIQNFLNYKTGRNPVKQLGWKKFYKRLEELEKKFNTKLILSHKDFNIRKTKPLPKPFKKGQVITARIVMEGRLPDEKIAVSDSRNMTLYKCSKPIGKEVKVRILRSKHNIFSGIVA